MSKRELELFSGGCDIEGPKTKRRREASGLDKGRLAPFMATRDEGRQEFEESLVQQRGIKLWQTIKDFINKEGRPLSTNFLRRPSKRLYPDYYQIIKRPIALEEMKKTLDANNYPTLEAVKADLELCFLNAKEYNMKESVIWNDAHELLKLVYRTYGLLVSPEDEIETVDTDGKGKSKIPNLTRLMKSRLQKLVDKTDETGRTLSLEFMELPSRKLWPIYYKAIKRPQCIENIFKRIKRKEYFDANEFAADVELVFSNALEFNQEHTPIWEDARILRDYFRHLMADMPPPFTIAKYIKPSTGKIKIKMPPMLSLVQPSTTLAPVVLPTPVPTAQKSSSSTSLVLRVPAPQEKSSQASTPASNDASLPDASCSTPSCPALPSLLAIAPTTPPVPSVSSISLSTNPTIPSSTTTTISASKPSLEIVPQPPSASFLTRPPAPYREGGLKSVALTTKPIGRLLCLDYSDGVTSWVMRLTQGETEVHVEQVAFLDDEGEQCSSDEGDNDVEEQKDGNDLVQEVLFKGNVKKTKAKNRGKAKPNKGTSQKSKTTYSKKKQKTSVQVKLNGALIRTEQDRSKWVLQPMLGMNLVEVGENGGLFWKVYVQRTTA